MLNKIKETLEYLSNKQTKFISNLIPDKDIEKTSILFLFVVAFCLIAIIWGSFTKIDQVVRATGQAIPASKIQVVQSVYGGVINNINVKLGDKVKKSDELFSIDETNAEAKYNSNEEAYSATMLEVETRLKRVKLIEDLVTKGAEAEMRLLDEQLLLVDAQRRLSQISANREAYKQEKDQSIIRAPVDGEVSVVYVSTEGEVIQAGQLLAEIVPKDDKLLIEASILPKDISFVKKDQKAKVSFSAYDPSVYGTFEGVVKEVSASTNVDRSNRESGMSYYAALIEISDEELSKNNIIVRSGMQADVSIIGQERTVVGYIFNPVTKLSRQAFREN